MVTRGLSLNRFPLARRVARLFLLPVALVAATGCDIAMAGHKEKETAEWRKTFDVRPGGLVEIRNINGKIDVTTAQGNSVEVVAKKTGHGASVEAAKEALSRVEIRDSATADGIKVETRLERSGNFFDHAGATVEYVVKVPANVELKLTTVNGGVEVTGVTGRVTAEATNGGVVARDISGPIEASTTNGGVDVDVATVPENGIKLECTNGGIRLKLPADAKASVSARVTNGGIDTAGLPVQVRGEATRRRLDGDLNGGGPRISLEGTNGGIKISAR